MILIETNHKSFEDYLAELSRPAYKNYKMAMKRNRDLHYQVVPFDREECKRFMELWEKQLIRGEHRQWAYPVEAVEQWEREGRLMCFRAMDGIQPIAYHYILKHVNFWQCEPVLYDKKYSERYLAKYMWFNLIKYAIEHKLQILNMGGGPDNWHEHIMSRDQYPNPAYKWMYVPEITKTQVRTTPNYKLIKTADGLQYLQV